MQKKGIYVLIQNQGNLGLKSNSNAFLELIEEIYDERYKFEFTEYVGEPPPQHPLTSLVPAQFQSLGKDQEDNPELQAPSISTAVFVYQFLSKIFGLKTIVDQICWDILYTMTLLEDDFNEKQNVQINADQFNSSFLKNGT